MFTFNAALNRPSFQSSVYTDTDGTVYPASLANDGHRDTSSGCSVTRRENSPWWAVDLGGPTAVVRVDLTNIAATQCGRPMPTFSDNIHRKSPDSSRVPDTGRETSCRAYCGNVSNDDVI